MLACLPNVLQGPGFIPQYWRGGKKANHDRTEESRSLIFSNSYSKDFGQFVSLSLSICYLSYQKLQKITLCTSPHPIPTKPNQSDTDHAAGFSPLLTSKMPRLAAGGADGSVRAGKPQCCGQTHISATGIFQRKGLYTHQWSLFNSQTQTSGFSYFCGKTMAPQTFQMLLTNITYVCVCELSYELWTSYSLV